MLNKSIDIKEKRNGNQNIGKEIRENKEYVDYKFDYIKTMEKGFGNIWKISRRSRLKESVPHGTEILQIGTNRTNKYR